MDYLLIALLIIGFILTLMVVRWIHDINLNTHRQLEIMKEILKKMNENK